MNHKTFAKRWQRGVRSVPHVLEGYPEVTWNANVSYSVAPLGDFMKEYIVHLKIPWWRRHRDWGLVEGAFRAALNVMQVEFTHH